MAVVITPDQPWLPPPLTYIILFLTCFFSLYFSKNPSISPSSLTNPFDFAPFLRFQRSFLLVFSLSSVIEGLAVVVREFEFVDYGIGRDEIVVYLAGGALAAVFLGSFSGILSDIIGPRKVCLLFCVLHLFVGILKTISGHPSIWVTSICFSLASSIFSFCFETWMVNEHEKQDYKQDLMNETFWVMTFFESTSLLGSQMLANMLVKDGQTGFLSPTSAVSLLAVTCILCINKQWKGNHPKPAIANYRKAFVGHIIKDKKIWLLACAQTCIYFSTSVVWFLWAPTIVADGRVINLSLIYPCFLGSRMIGSTLFPWIFGDTSSLHSEDCPIYAYIVAAISLFIVAYDYQEIGFLVTLFCIFQVCVGLILPSLARYRTTYVPNELRGGMIAVSLAPANAAIWFILIQGGYYHNLGNAVIFSFSAIGLLIGAGCIHVLRQERKQSRRNWHKL